MRNEKEPSVMNESEKKNVPFIMNRYFIEFIIKKGGHGFGYKHAHDFREVEKKFYETYDAEKYVLVTIKFVGVMIDDLYYKATDIYLKD